MSFGAKIAEARKAAGLSQKELAGKVDPQLRVLGPLFLSE